MGAIPSRAERGFLQRACRGDTVTILQQAWLIGYPALAAGMAIYTMVQKCDPDGAAP
jgi:hypothetical protein